MNLPVSPVNSLMPRIETINSTRPSVQTLPSFLSVLDQFAPDRPADISGVDGGTGAEDARSAAAQFVGMAFIQPILAQLRESSIAEGPFAPTTAEKRFGPMMDQMMSDRITEAANFPLIDSVARQLTATRVYAGEKSHG